MVDTELEYVSSTVAEKQMIVVEDGYVGTAIERISAIGLCISDMVGEGVAEIGFGIAIMIIIILSHSPFPWSFLQCIGGNGGDEAVVFPHAVRLLFPCFMLNVAVLIMSHTVGVNHTTAAVELGSCHHFLVGAIDPYRLHCRPLLMCEQKTAPATFPVAKLSHIEVVEILASDNAQSVGHISNFIGFALIATSIGQREPLFGFKPHIVNV